MKLFEGHREYRAALEMAAAGGQALFLHPWGAPSHIRCFNGVRWIGKLFDRDRSRLVTTGRRLGVRVIVVDREGQESQHIDLVGRPLERAKGLCTHESSVEAVHAS